MSAGMEGLAAFAGSRGGPKRGAPGISSYLLPSIVRVLRAEQVMRDGIATTTYEPVLGMERIPTRLEVNFNRPGKDVLPPQQAGRAPDRVAVYWVDPGWPIRPGDVLDCLSGPVEGRWEVRVAPDPAQGMSRTNHLEGQCVEMNSSITDGEVL